VFTDSCGLITAMEDEDEPDRTFEIDNPPSRPPATATQLRDGRDENSRAKKKMNEL